MWRKIVVAFACFSIVYSSLSQNSADILLEIKKMGTTGSVLYIAAHPDDENTRLLAYLANERKMRTGYLSLTRGDGGQNLIGDEQGVALGLIRTHELLQARGIDRAEQFFSRAYDFGYSKNPEETFGFWNRDSVLADMVWVIRKFKPDVIICRFPTTGEGGHGHHTASAILAEDAFEAAADPTKFSWQLKHTEVWQAKRLLWNTFNFGSTNTTSEDQLKIDVGAYNQLMGRSYGEIASESRSMHKSQGFGSARQRGINYEYFKLMKGSPAEKDLFDGVETSWTRIAAASGIQALINDVVYNFKSDAPQNALPQLLEIRKKIQNLSEKDPIIRYWKTNKLAQVEKIILGAAGFFAESVAADFMTVPGSETLITSQVLQRNGVDCFLEKIVYPNTGDSIVNKALGANELNTFKHLLKVPSDASTTNPYWLNQAHTSGEFLIEDLTIMGAPVNAPAFEVEYRIKINGESMIVKVPVRYKYTDPVKGEVYRELEVLPAVTINADVKSFVFNELKPKTLLATIRSNAPSKGEVRLIAPKGWICTVEDAVFDFSKKNQEKRIKINVIPSANASNEELKLTLVVGDKTYNQAITRIEYDHIPYQFILSESKVKLVLVDLKIGKRKIGYIPGAGDLVVQSLRQVGYQVDELSDEFLASGDLSQYEAIISGVRAYNVNERLEIYQSNLMKYVENGGNYIVQYNTNSRVGPIKTGVGPFPFTVSRNRVTDEKSPVSFLIPTHSCLNVPNKISMKDFEGWVQERGIYFATEIDSSYQKILAMNDAGEDSFDGSLIVAKYGKGHFVYTGLAFFRQLPAGVPGAYRLFSNLIDLK
jgi:LmbE family N-acetylglucosaminyl deacetylase